MAFRAGKGGGLGLLLGGCGGGGCSWSLSTGGGGRMPFCLTPFVPLLPSSIFAAGGICEETGGLFTVRLRESIVGRFKLGGFAVGEGAGRCSACDLFKAAILWAREVNWGSSTSAMLEGSL